MFMRKTKKRFSEIPSIIIRYLILVLTGIPNLWIFYFIFTPLTVYATYFLLGLFFDVSLMRNIVLISNYLPIEIIRACVAGSAYYLLLILNLATPKIKFNQRMKLILFSFSSFFVLNILRIILLSFALVRGVSWFDFAHIFFWYIGSIVFVIGIWFIGVRMFKVKEVPFYSDLKLLASRIKKKL